MENETKILHRAKKLTGKNVEITRRKRPQAWLPGMEFGTVTLNGTIKEVSDGFISMTDQCGMEKTLLVRDNYFVVESIREV